MAVLAESTTQSPLRAAITASYRLPEPACVAALIPAATLTPEAQDTARHLVTALRARPKKSGIDALLREYALSSEEGVALMCLAEALLRIPDAAARDALIRDKIGGADWRAHLGHSPSLFVNAATWGLVVTGKLTAAPPEARLADALKPIGAPIIRKSVELAMRLMGEQFVMGQTIGDALHRAVPMEARRFRYSYDMLGEAAATADDAASYFQAYLAAIAAIGAAAKGRGIYNGPGISIKLSALHARYTRSQRDRVLTELLPRVQTLVAAAMAQNIGVNIDAEESDRLDLSLDILEALCTDQSFAGWHGIGFVVQAYQKRAPFVLDYCIDLARRTGHRLMIRLVKGAYWDSEIKRAQVDGQSDFPVFTRKPHTDISYIACANILLRAGADVYPQFATHNALTLATIHAIAGGAEYEFQCLHGMGEPLYEQVVGANHLGVPCRIYAPVGTHETLLAYLVRRLLENGANSSFVNRISDPAVSIDDLLIDPATLPGVGTKHDKIALPADIYGPTRRNAAGLDLSNEATLAALASAAPAFQESQPVEGPWAEMPPAQRAAILRTAADRLEAARDRFIQLLVMEARKTIPNAISEIREAVDFLCYYAAGVEGWNNGTHRPLGRVVCISPWNFPLAIFLGQVAAALAAGNIVYAKPAEETPEVARQAIHILWAAGVPGSALHYVPGDGMIGASLVADPATDGVIFTGSTAVARLIQAQLAERLSPDGAPIPLIAETGGQNAMIVDSSALAEQVVADVLASAFDSAGQRCSALRVLCLQEEAAPKILTMLKGAITELRVGPPERLATDIGPVITAEAQSSILAYIETMREAGYPVFQMPVPAEGGFVPPTLIEIPSLNVLGPEIFGPVLHVVRFARSGLMDLVQAINATGYALTFGLHTRISETELAITKLAAAGNIYVNRNIVGAVVGVQPFGGHGLSGTGPKAGGPLYLHRLLRTGPAPLLAQGDLPGPVGERNAYTLEPRGTILCLTPSLAPLARAVGNRVITEWDTSAFDAVLMEGTAQEVITVQQRLAALPGPVIPLFVGRVAPVWLMRERCVSTNTTAAGGNANLLLL
jgi:RHH-type proline utilization regulon transcriptional repressor/proline dehydrogenase/delta 1-pyrroline-5-carboxylate dehydrogenase